MNKLMRSAAVAVVAAATMLATPAAFAAPHDGECTSGEACVFRNQQYGGGMADFGSNDSNWIGHAYSTGYSTHDSASSGFSIDRAKQFWVNVNFTGYSFILGANYYDQAWTTSQPNNNAPAGFSFNDKVDSHANYVP